MRKNVRELEEELRDKDRQIRDLRDQVALYQNKVECIEKTLKNTPEDCKPGEYCKACAFSKVYMVKDPYTGWHEMYLCNKNGACKNFVQRSEDE